MLNKLRELERLLDPDQNDYLVALRERIYPIRGKASLCEDSSCSLEDPYLDTYQTIGRVCAFGDGYSSQFNGCGYGDGFNELEYGDGTGDGNISNDNSFFSGLFRIADNGQNGSGMGFEGNWTGDGEG